MRISDKEDSDGQKHSFFLFLAYFKRIFGNLWNHQIECTLLEQIKGLWLCNLHDSGRKESSLYWQLYSHLLPSLPSSLLILKSPRCLFYKLSNQLGCQWTLVTDNKQKRDLATVLQNPGTPVAWATVQSYFPHRFWGCQTKTCPSCFLIFPILSTHLFSFKIHGNPPTSITS